MDKNMINIDDLFRQRLADAEVPQQPGSWSRMKGLLDEHMPQDATVPANKNWRRSFGLLAGVILLAALSVGGYQMSHSFFSDGGGSGSIASNDTAPAISTGVAGMADDIATGRTATETNTAEEFTSANNSSNNYNSSNNNRPSNSATVAAISNNISSKSENVAKNSTTQNATKRNNSSTIDSDENTATPRGNSLNNSDLNAVSSSFSSGDLAANNNIKNAESATKRNNIQEQQEANKNALREEKAYLMVAGNMQTIPTKDGKESITFRKIVKQQSLSQNGKWETDTIFNGMDKIEVDNPAKSAPVASAQTTSNAESAIAPASALQATSDNADNEEFPMENLADHKVDSKKSNMYHNPKRFEEMVKNTKYHMGRIKFYPGIVAGATYNATNNNILGAQFGLAMDVSIGDRWGLLTEAKYIYRYNGKANLQNDYISNVQTKYVNGTQIHTYDSIEHSYNFNSFGTLEVPLAITYKINRFTVFGGGNLNYNFKINNVDEVEVKHFKEVEALSTNTNIYNKESDKTVLLSDFAPSFNVGYVFGAGYSFTPALRMDVRVAQPLLNNASTNGQKEMYKQIYNMPSMQFNIRYRFGNNKMKPYRKP